MRKTTRAGRRIRHVAPGHVVDVATGIKILERGWDKRWVVDGLPRWWPSSMGVPDRGRLETVLSLIDTAEKRAIAAGICAFVTWAVRS